MKVRMLAHRTGGRYDGRDWPLPGEILETSDAEADHLIRAGDAQPVVAEPKPRTPRTPKAAAAG